MHEILNLLGYSKEQVYEKWRETLSLDGTEFCLDTMPFGDFLEIEGEKESITFYAKKLGLPWESRILSNYLGIFEMIKKRMDLPFRDVTFSNFKGVKVDLRDYLPFIEAGDGGS